MGSQYDLSSSSSKSKMIFNSPAKFVSPQELNYQLPTRNLPEFAFIGRSNVGKSSLISTLLSKDRLVRVSKGSCVLIK